MLKILLLTLGLLLGGLLQANAATCFWVGGAGNWDNSNTASWASSSGGTTGTCAAGGGIPKNAGDVATFDGSSGGGTVTVCGAASANCPTSSGVVSLAQITMGAFTGTLDFATNNPNVTLTTAFSGTGSGARTLNMGSGTWTLSAASGVVWDCTTVTNFTLNANTSTLAISATIVATRNIILGAKSYNNVSIDSGGATLINDFASAGAFTIGGTFSVTNTRQIRFAAGVTQTITGAWTWNGTSSAQSLIYTNGGATTLSVGASNTLNWLAVQNVTKAGAGSITCNNCFNLGNNTSVTINAPTGGAKIIGSGV